MQHRFCPCYPRSVLQLVWQAIAFLGRTWLVAKVCRSVTLFPPTRRPVRPVAEFKNFAVRGTASLPSSPPPPPPSPTSPIHSPTHTLVPPATRTLIFMSPMPFISARWFAPSVSGHSPSWKGTEPLNNNGSHETWRTTEFLMWNES